MRFGDGNINLQYFRPQNARVAETEKMEKDKKSRELVAFSKGTSTKSGGGDLRSPRGGSRLEIGEIFVSDLAKKWLKK